MTGLDVLRRQDFAPLRGKRVGLVTHPAALANDFQSSLELFADATACQLVALFGPEHGLSGEAQDLIPVAANAILSMAIISRTAARPLTTSDIPLSRCA